MKLHERVMPVQRANAEFGMMFNDFCEKHELTQIEAIGLLTGQIDMILKYMLRFERHGDYETPSGRANEEPAR